MDHQAIKAIQEVYQACKDVGFFYITGHGVKQSTLDLLFSDALEFFNLSAEKKNAFTSIQNTNSQDTLYIEQSTVYYLFLFNIGYFINV